MLKQGWHYKAQSPQWEIEARIMCIILAKWQACQASLSRGNLSTFYYVQIKADKVAQKVTRMPCGELAKWRG